jgi:cell division protein FtsA
MKQYFVGVDVGSANVVMVVGSRTEGSELLNIEGVSIQESRKSVKEGRLCTTLTSAVINLSNAISDAKDELEEALGIKIEQAYFGLGNSDTRCVIVEDFVPVKNKKTGVIGKEDITILRQLLRQVKTESCSEKVFEICPLAYYVNGTKRTLNPVGMQGSWLKGEYLLSIGLNDQINTLKQLHHKVGMEIQKVFVNPMITFPLLVSEQEAEEGVVIVDIGSEVTDITIVREKKVQYFRSISAGAEYINTDLKSILPKGANCSKIKHLYGTAISGDIAENQVIQVGTKEVIHRNIATVIEARLMDIAELVARVVRESGLESKIVHGYVLTGGTAATDKIEQLFERETNRPCRLVDKLYGIGSKPQDCEITPGQHAAVAIMMQAAKYASSYVVEKEPAPKMAEPQLQVEPSVPSAPSEPAVEPIVEPAAQEDTPKVVTVPIPTTPVQKPTPSKEEERDGAPAQKSGTLAKFKRLVNISRWMGSEDNKSK